MITDAPLLIEVGNTTAKIGRVDEHGTIHVERHSTVAAAAVRAAEQAQLVVDPFGVWPNTTGARFVERGHFRHFLEGSYDDLDTVGVDRILNLLGLSGDGIVVSCGTAITIDALHGGRPLFGAILPGFRTTLAALHDRIPALPLVDLSQPTRLPARTTREAIANGVLMGTAAATGALVKQLREASFGGWEVVTWFTGGDAGTMTRQWSQEMGSFIVDDTLLFKGLARHAGIHPSPSPVVSHRGRTR